MTYPKTRTWKTDPQTSRPRVLTSVPVHGLKSVFYLSVAVGAVADAEMTGLDQGGLWLC